MEAPTVAPNLRPTYFEVGLTLMLSVQVTVLLSELRRARVPGAARHSSTGLAPPQPGQYKSLILFDQQETDSNELFLGNWGRANLPKPGAAPVRLPDLAPRRTSRTSGHSGTYLSKPIESQYHK